MYDRIDNFLRNTPGWVLMLVTLFCIGLLGALIGNVGSSNDDALNIKYNVQELPTTYGMYLVCIDDKLWNYHVTSSEPYRILKLMTPEISCGPIEIINTSTSIK